MWRRRPIFTALVLISLLLAIAFASWWVASYELEWPEHEDVCIPLGGNWRIGCFWGMLSLYNCGWPYSGSILGVGGTVDYHAAWNAPGIYLRYLTYYGPPFPPFTLFTLSVWPGYAVLLCLLLPMLWVWRSRQEKRARLAAGICIACGYDLRGSGGTCPECGAQRNVGSV